MCRGFGIHHARPAIGLVSFEIGGDMSEKHAPAQRVRVEQGIYQQPNGKYAVCFMVDGRPRFRTVGFDLDAARIERAAYIDATRWGVAPAAPRLRFARVAGWWAERYERRVESGERRERTLARRSSTRFVLPAADPVFRGSVRQPPNWRMKWKLDNLMWPRRCGKP